MSEKLGQAIRREREALKMQQTEIAAAVGISQASWSRHERGEAEMTVKQAVAALKALGCHVTVWSARDEILWDSRGYTNGNSK